MNADGRPGVEEGGHSKAHGWGGCASVSRQHGAFGESCAFKFEVLIPSRRSFDCLKRLTLGTWNEQKLGSLEAQKKKNDRTRCPDWIGPDKDRQTHSLGSQVKREATCERYQQ